MLFTNWTQVVSGRKQVIWCLGSSIVRDAFVHARSHEPGINLGIEQAVLWWQGYSGLRLKQTKQKIRCLASYGDQPSIVVLHCGGNDLGHTDLKTLRKYVSEVFQFLLQIFPTVKIIWSEILPRRVWRYSENKAAMEAARKRINRFAGKLAIKSRGSYLRHPVLCQVQLNFLKNDGVHLNTIGNELFIKQLRKGILFSMENQYYIS